MTQDNMTEKQQYLESFQDRYSSCVNNKVLCFLSFDILFGVLCMLVRFLVACNRPENDEHWSSDAEEWKGKASMAAKHQFLIIKGEENNDNKIHWQWYKNPTLPHHKVLPNNFLLI